MDYLDERRITNIARRVGETVRDNLKGNLMNASMASYEVNVETWANSSLNLSYRNGVLYKAVDGRIIVKGEDVSKIPDLKKFYDSLKVDIEKIKEDSTTARLYGKLRRDDNVLNVNVLFSMETLEENKKSNRMEEHDSPFAYVYKEEDSVE